ncbi:MAG: hypothetical protein NVS4B11_01110 [Ktedonobacteraceae bacterium]
MLHEHTYNTDRTKVFFIHLQEAFLARKGLIAYIPITFVVIIMFIAASWEVFIPTTDPARYQCYALTFWFGSNGAHLLPPQQCSFLSNMGIKPPFHLLPLEYPPLTLVPFSLALLAPISYYQLVFAFLMALTAVLIYWLLLRYGPRGAGLIFTLYLLGGAVATAHVRFDLLPAALTLISLIAAERRHWTSAYVALAFGVLLKIYPILLLPALFIAEQQADKRFYIPTQSLSLAILPRYLWDTLRGIRLWRWKNCLLFFGVLGGVTAAFALLNFQGAIMNQLLYFAQRPVQIESSGSTILWFTKLFGVPLNITNEFGSINITNSFSAIVSLLSTLLLVVGFAYCLLQQWCGKMDIVQTGVALIFVFIATGKVFSPQYIIWLIPLLAYVGAFDAFWCFFWGPAAVLTTIIFAYFYTRPVDPLTIPLTPGFFQVIAIRNMFFVLVTLAYLFNWFNVRQRRLPALLTGRETKPLIKNQF